MKKRINIKRKNKSITDIANYPMVSVEWLDIESNSAWQNLKELQNAKLPICITKGHLFSQSKGITRIFGDYSKDDNDEITEIGNSTIIPNSVIVSIKKI
jgi:hypothetical protein